MLQLAANAHRIWASTCLMGAGLGDHGFLHSNKAINAALWPGLQVTSDMGLPEFDSEEEITQHVQDLMLLHANASELLAAREEPFADCLPCIAAAALLSNALEGAA